MMDYLIPQSFLRNPLVIFPSVSDFPKQSILSNVESVKSRVSFEGIRLFADEKVLEVQRQHAITLLMPFLVVALFLLTALGLLIAFFNSQYAFEFSYLKIALLFTSAFISFAQIFSLYTFMSWFYQFYIITSKRLVSVHFFRIGGFHLDEVFHDQTNPLEIDRHPQNFMLDLLGIEDLYVYFQRFERPEPFVFKAPENHVRIGELLESHCLKKDEI